MLFCKRKISPARRVFRRILVVILVPTLLFSIVTTVLYSSTNGNYRKMRAIAPAMTHVDVSLRQIRVYFKDDAEKFDTAFSLCRQSTFSSIYGDGCLTMMKSLSDDGYAPAQTIQANILINRAGTDVEYHRALGLYRQAALQNYEPAIIKLALLESVK